MSVDNYNKLKSGESFLKIKEFEKMLLEPLKKIFWGNSELENYLLDIMLTFLSLAVGKNISKKNY